eukprot:4544177-Ditylum_brightwellii.AAC.1
MFTAPAYNIYGALLYGAAAIPASLGGGYWMAEGCGKCWRVTSTNENPMCGAGTHFDTAAPEFDVTVYSFAHTCPNWEPEEADGFAACGNWLIMDDNPDMNCDCSLFNDDV